MVVLTKMSDLTNSVAWQALEKHKIATWQTKRTHLRSLFEAEPQRAQTFSLQAADLWIDYSKNLVSTETIELLLDLAHAPWRDRVAR